MRGASRYSESALVVLRGAFFETKTCAFSKVDVFLLRGACFQTCQIICVLHAIRAPFQNHAVLPCVRATFFHGPDIARNICFIAVKLQKVL